MGEGLSHWSSMVLRKSQTCFFDRHTHPNSMYSNFCHVLKYDFIKCAIVMLPNLAFNPHKFCHTFRGCNLFGQFGHNLYDSLHIFTSTMIVLQVLDHIIGRTLNKTLCNYKALFCILIERGLCQQHSPGQQTLFGHK